MSVINIKISLRLKAVSSPLFMGDDARNAQVV